MRGMKPRVYVETSVISYLTAKPSRDLIVAAHQELTREWWESGTHEFELCVSEVVLDEASRGNTEAARLRLGQLEGLSELPVSQESVDLAEALLKAGALPQQAYADALHVAVCAVHGIDILVTWNCKHIANVIMFSVIDKTCRNRGFEPPRICTPIELWGMQ